MTVKQYSTIKMSVCPKKDYSQCIDYILDLCITRLSARCAVALRLTRISSSTASNAVDACGHQQSVEEPLIKKSKSAREVQVVRKYRQSFPTGHHYTPFSHRWIPSEKMGQNFWPPIFSITHRYMYIKLIIDSGWQSFALNKSWFSSSGFLLVPRFATTRSSNLLKNIRNPSNSATRDSLNAYFCLDLWQSFESQIEFPDWQKLSTTTRVPSGSWRGQWWKTFTTTQAGCFQTRWLDFFDNHLLSTWSLSFWVQAGL